MEKLHRKYMDGWTIIEYHAGGENIVGKIEYTGVSLDVVSSFVIGWNQHDGFNRTTRFMPSSWKCDIVEEIIFLKRIAEDEQSADIPSRESVLYTIFLAANR